MQHDRLLLEQLSAFAPITFEGEVFRATPKSLDPLAPSLSGGRWMFPSAVPTLYTALEADGALAEITFHWSMLNPVPSKPAMLHRLRLGATKSVRLLRGDLVTLGVDWGHYKELGYTRTQEIGAAVSHLECNGLIAPSARWECENVMLFFPNHVRAEDLATVVHSELVDWREWGKAHGFL